MSAESSPLPSLAVASSRYQFKQTVVTVPPNTWTQLCQADVRRWGLRLQVASSAGSGAIFALSAALGSLSAPAGGANAIEVKYRDFPSQCGAAWFGFLTTGFTALVTEEIYLG